MEIITLAGGCFWCTEAIFTQLKGVESVISGYSGGDVVNPSYQEVCTGTTGHAESVQITFDPSLISLSDLLYVFFKLHNPTTLNQQGADIGPQYRSAVFYHNSVQKIQALSTIQNLQTSYKDKIVTEVTAYKNFYPADSAHKEYYLKNKGNTYCALVIDPKIQKLKMEFKSLIKE